MIIKTVTVWWLVWTVHEPKPTMGVVVQRDLRRVRRHPVGRDIPWDARILHSIACDRLNLVSNEFYLLKQTVNLLLKSYGLPCTLQLNST